MKSSSSLKSSFLSSDRNKYPSRGGSGGGASGGDNSGGKIGSGENGGVWGGFIVEGDGSVGIVLAGVVVNNFGFFILDLPFLVSVNVFEFCEASTSNVFFSKTKNKVSRWWGGFIMNLS